MILVSMRVSFSLHIPLQNLEIESIPVFGIYNHGHINTRLETYILVSMRVLVLHIPLQNLEIESIPVFGIYNHGHINTRLETYILVRACRINT